MDMYTSNKKGICAQMTHWWVKEESKETLESHLKSVF